MIIETMDTYDLPAFIIVNGKPGQGKTHWIKNFTLHHASRFTHGCVFTHNPQQHQYMPRRRIFTGSDAEEKIAAILDHQDDTRKRKGNPDPMLLIFDDFLNVKFNGHVLTKLFTEFRHKSITIILSTQWVNKVPPVARQCATHAITFKTQAKKVLDALFENYATDFDNWRELKMYIGRVLLEDYQHLAIKTAGHGHDKYRVRKCGLIPQFKLEF